MTADGVMSPAKIGNVPPVENHLTCYGSDAVLRKKPKNIQLSTIFRFSTFNILPVSNAASQVGQNTAQSLVLKYGVCLTKKTTEKYVPTHLIRLFVFLILLCVRLHDVDNIVGRRQHPIVDCIVDCDDVISPSLSC